MKRIYTQTYFKKINQKRAKRQLKRKLAFKLYRRNKNKRKIGKKKIEQKEESLIAKYKKVNAPQFFSFIENAEETILFINKLEKLYLSRKSVFVNLKNIQVLDYSAVTILVSIMFSFKARNIKFNGNFPKDEKLARLLVNSDFFKYLQKPVGDKLEYSIGKDNQIFTRANKEVNSELGLIVMMEASKTVWGEKRTCKGIQRVLIELMQNTNNHANINKKGEKHWWLSVNHDKLSKKVSFIFVDYGVGIFESLKNKPQTNKWFGWFEKIKNKLKYGGNEEIFRLLINGQMHLTVTGQHFRGKGLPGLKEVLERNQISNLKIVSNNVFADIGNELYKKIKTEFSGTFVTWELNENNVNTEWIL